MTGAGSTILTRMRDKILSPDGYLKQVRGVIHVGANRGQERYLYAAYGLQVVWIEPNPAVFERLKQNLIDFPKQAAYQRLVAAEDGVRHTLHISNNDGESSSILELAEHRSIWPEVVFTDSIDLEAVTLPTLFREERIDLASFDALVLDTQGSELLILQGAVDLLPGFRFIKTEVADFESYEGGCQLPELDAFLTGHGFKRRRMGAFAKSPKGGKYYDVLYQRR